jgi:N-succinyl-L-ornithine transcarbamylase
MEFEFENGAIMNQGASEHIKEAAEVVSQYCDIIAVRACRISRQGKDNAETVWLVLQVCDSTNRKYMYWTSLQALADAITMEEHKTEHRPKVLSWAPHPKSLPQAVANTLWNDVYKMQIL